MTTRTDLIACHDCDALHRPRALSRGGVAVCRRCGAQLYRHPIAGPDFPLALSLAGVVLFIIANSYPLLLLELGGRMQESTLFSCVGALLHREFWFLAVLVFCTTLLFPLLVLLCTVYLLLPFKLWHRPGRWVGRVFRLLRALTPWSMTGVHTLGILVAIVKLRDLATVIPGTALYAFFGLLLVLVAAGRALDPYAFWQLLEARA